MDWAGIAGLITGILSIPSSIYVVVQIRRDLSRPVETADAARQRYSQFLRLRGDTNDRVLLAFDKDNETVEGSFEHLVYQFWKKFSAYNYETFVFDRHTPEGFIFRPLGSLASYKHRCGYEKNQLAMTTIYGLIALVFPITAVFRHDPPVTEWEVFIFSCIFVVCIGLFGVSVYWFYRTCVRLKMAMKALAIIQEYVDTLRELEIVAQVEFTQSKRKFDELRGQFSTRDGSSPNLSLGKAAA